MNTRGIVFTAGGQSYFANAYLNCRLLRDKGCTLPIEWFYLGDEMKPEWIKIIQEMISDIVLIDLGGTGPKEKAAGGWQSKIEAIMKSSFDEVLYLDADSFPVENPEYLFSHPFFTETSAVLFPDVWCWEPERAISLNSKYGITLPQRQVESGQMLFNKERCEKALELIKGLNQNPETYKILYGDKDTFLIGFLMSQEPFEIIKFPPAINRGILLQYDPDGKPAFRHLTGAKWQLHGRPFVTKDLFPDVEKAREILKDVRDRLCP